MNIFKKFIISDRITFMDSRQWLFTNILVVIVLTVFALIIFDIIFVASFNAIFKKHQKAMLILLDLKCDSVKGLSEMLDNDGVELDEKTRNLIVSIDRKDLDNPGSKEFENCLTNLTFLTNNLTTIVNRNKELFKREDYVLVLNNIKDSDRQFRTIVTMYNADCLGYNYWISFYPTRYIWAILKFKKRNLIEL